MLQRTRAWLVYAGLTLPLGLLGHVLFELVGGVSSRTGSIGAEHGVLVLTAGTVIALAVADLRRGSRAERIVRTSRMRRALPSGARLALAGVALQTIVSAATLAAEGVSLDPAHLAFAAVVAIVSVLFGALAFSAAKDSILAFAAALICVSAGSGVSPCFACAWLAIAGHSSCTIRLHAGRGPPFVPAR